MSRFVLLLVCIPVAMLLLVGISPTVGQEGADSLADLRKAVRKLQEEVAALKKEMTVIRAQVAELRAEKPAAAGELSLAVAKQQIVGRWQLDTPAETIWFFGRDGAFSIVRGKVRGSYDVKENTLKRGQFVLVLKLPNQGPVTFGIRSFTKDVIVLSGPEKVLTLSRIRE